MVSDTTAWPRKTRELRSQLLNSSVWNEFRFRPDDVVIATYAKAGTTWTQQIVAQLIFGGRDGLDVATLSPWLDLRVPPKEVKLRALEAQRHRRFIKTHLPVDALVFSPEAKYIYVGRDGRDVVWSLYNHHASVSDDWYRLYNDTPGRVGPPLGPPPASIRQYFLEWLERDGYPFWSFWDNVSSWWAIRHLPNVLFLHFADLKRDLPGQMRRVAAFLEIELDKMAFDAAVRHCGFDYMKAHAVKHAPHHGRFFKGGAQTFILAEFRRASAATRRYEDLRWGSGRCQGIAPADIPPRIFEEFTPWGTARRPATRAPSKAGNPPDASAGDLSAAGGGRSGKPSSASFKGYPTRSPRRPASTISRSGKVFTMGIAHGVQCRCDRCKQQFEIVPVLAKLLGDVVRFDQYSGENERPLEHRQDHAGKFLCGGRQPRAVLVDDRL